MFTNKIVTACALMLAVSNS